MGVDVVYDLSRAPQSLSEAADNQKHADIQHDNECDIAFKQQLNIKLRFIYRHF